MRSKTAQKHQCCTKLVLPTIYFPFFWLVCSRSWTFTIIIVGGGDDDDQLLVCLVWSSIFTSGRSPLEGTTPICYQINKHFAHPPRSYTCMHNYWRHTLIYLCAHISHTCLSLISITFFRFANFNHNLSYKRLFFVSQEEKYIEQLFTV